MARHPLAGGSSCRNRRCQLPAAILIAFVAFVNARLHHSIGSIPRKAAFTRARRHHDEAVIVDARKSSDGESLAFHSPRCGGSKGARGYSTIPESVMNLVKSIVGVGILGVPAGIAAFGDAPSALLPALVAIGFMGAVSGYTFTLIGKVCSETGASSYGEAWEKSIGEHTAWVPSLSCILDCFGGNVSFSMMLADTFKRLLEVTSGVMISRTKALLAVTVFVLLPLCLVKNLSSLAPFSLIGVLGAVYTAVAMGIRYFDGSYQTPGGELLADVLDEHQPLTKGTRGASSFLDPRAFILISMLSKSFATHFVGPQFHADLLNNTPKRFGAVVFGAFGTSMLITFAIASFGYLTFGGSSSGLILDNYSPRDKLIGLGHAAAAVSVLTSYPLCFAGGRDGLIDLMGVHADGKTDTFRCLVTVLALALITAIAAVATDLSTSLALRGATLGNALTYIYPALMFRAAIKKRKSNTNVPIDAEERRDMHLSTACTILGVATGILGTIMVLERWRGS